MWEWLERREIRRRRARSARIAARRGIAWPGAGARPRPDLPEGTDLLPQIRHIVILMMENHSYDNYLGMLAGRVRACRSVPAAPRTSSTTPRTGRVSAPTTCPPPPRRSTIPARTGTPAISSSPARRVLGGRGLTAARRLAQAGRWLPGVADRAVGNKSFTADLYPLGLGGCLRHLRRTEQFFADADAGTLPAVSIVDPAATPPPRGAASRRGAGSGT